MSASPDVFDVVVIGRGAAGCAAARSAHAAGATRVALVGDGAGATDMTSGWIAAGDGDLDAAAFAWFADAGFREVGAYAFASATGALVGALSGLPSLLDLTDLSTGPLGVVDLRAGPAWSAEVVARSLSVALSRNVKVLAAPQSAPAAETALEIGRALDTDGLVDALAGGLRGEAAGCSGLLFPPVLGLVRDDVCARLALRLGMAVGEAGGGPGDPTAVRFARTVARAVPSHVAHFDGRARIRADGASADVWVGESRRSARAVVLATGGLLGGGLAFDGSFVEPCAGAPVWFGPVGQTRLTLTVRNAERGMDPEPLFTPDTQGLTEAMRAGVRLNPDARIVGPDGATPIADWLFGAGAVVAGATRSYGPALAEVLVAGHRAGTRAAEHAKAAR